MKLKKVAKRLVKELSLLVKCQQKMTEINQQELMVHLDKLIDKDNVVIYIDGSYDEKLNIAGFGMLVLAEGKVKEYKGVVPCFKGLQMTSNIAELYAAGMAYSFLATQKYMTAIIKYDCQGIKDLLKKRTVNNDRFNRWYLNMYGKALKKCEIKFKKVKAHNSVKYNELVDTLARSAVLNAKISLYEKNGNVNRINQQKKIVKVKNAVNGISNAACRCKALALLPCRLPMVVNSVSYDEYMQA